jgi:hypothetical protein
MTSENPKSIMCIPWHEEEVEEDNRRYPDLPATKGECDRCGRDIRVDHSSRMLLEQFPDVPTRCIYCVAKELTEEKGE